MTTVQPSIDAFRELEDPIRGELFSTDRLEQHAESLAAAQAATTVSGPGRPFIPRVQENGRVLLEYYRTIAQAIQQEQLITPAAEWLVDNFYIVEEQLREIRDDLPSGYYRELPKLKTGHLEGYPRVFGVAWAFVAHTDSRFDPEVLRRFVIAYQRVQPLTIGELWAIAITLRATLLENLRRIAEQLGSSKTAREQADIVADRLLGTGGQTLAAPEKILNRFEKKPLERAFAVQLIQRLRDLDPKVGPILHWLDERLAAQGTTADEVVRAEHQEQASMSVTVRNIITSMRLTSAFDWQTFIESVSLVDEVLRSDPGYAEMDFKTRDGYRHAIEDLSRGSHYSEIEVAQRAVNRADRARTEKRNGSKRDDERRSNPGYYLISEGRSDFERELDFRLSWKYWLLRLHFRRAVPGYLGTIILLTVVILGLPLVLARNWGATPLQLVILGLLAAIPASDLAIALINRGVTELFGPRVLPRLELAAGVPEKFRTIIVVPTLLTSQKAIKEQIERLEVHYLANSEGDLRFALLSDWMDSATETLESDEELLAAATGGIESLNQRYGLSPGGDSRFLLLHRKRTWNESEKKWMGWERKRGKLHELNLFLRGSEKTSFLPVGGRPVKAIPGVHYVITLDADTRLPRGAAARMVGTMAHPLNLPLFDPHQGRVVEGYGIVQPRITPSLPSDGQDSIFQKVFSGPSGMDPYASAISDVYQDLFREGSYTGKGIYDIDAFEAALAGKVKENSILSHDLLEGIFARAALATDIELFEEFPSQFQAAAARQHRWARGDWQLLPWIFGRGGSPRTGGHSFRIPAISRWKMLDNLRRTLLAPAMFLTMLAGWLTPSLSPWTWTRFILITLSVPALLPFLAGLHTRLSGISKRTHIRGMLRDLSLGASQIGLTIAFLANQTWVMLDAVIRTVGRVFITRKNLLEWVTTAQTTDAVDLNLASIFKSMAGGVALAIVALLAVAFLRPHALSVAIPFVGLWCAAPIVARWISLPPTPSEAGPLSEIETQTMRLVSRRTWRFFETFVTPEDNSLPPDNFQETPRPVVAHRTSPTNIGLYLLSTITARDLGWLGTLDTVARLEATFATIGKLEKYRGHFFNWYDTRDLRPLDPKYVSSVDSGNIAGHLLAVGHACRDLMQNSPLDAVALAGIKDAIHLLREVLTNIADIRRTHVVTRKQLSNAVDALAAILEPPPENAADWAALLIELRDQAQTVGDIAQTLSAERGDPPDSELRVWAEAVKACVESHARDAEILIPWMRLDSAPIAALAHRSPEHGADWAAIEAFLHSPPSLADAPEHFAAALYGIASLRARLTSDLPGFQETISSLDTLAKALTRAAMDAAALLRRLLELARTSEKIFAGMDFVFLFDNTRKLFSIGFRCTDGTLDPNCYDLLASEARLASFIAIAKGDVPSSHWFHLGRALTPVGTGSALISWSGSMFEYLMPALVMRSPAGSLLNQTYDQVVQRQIEYGDERSVPWGNSESAYNARDLDFTYQYSSFGVPGLGLKRGLSEDLVIAPYATALAAMIDPSAAVQNLSRLAATGARGTYGFYESLDYTSSRLPEGQDVAVIRAYMAHHQAMSLVAFANVLTDGAMQARFHSEPLVQATALLLQERMPRDVLVARPRADEVSASAQVRELIPPVVRRFITTSEGTPRTQLLSNGRYSVMLTAAGSGYSRWQDLAITRWREDPTRDCWGTYIFLRDAQTGNVWSAGYQPSGAEPDEYEATFYEDHAEIKRRDRSLTTTLEVTVSPDDAEVRRLSITNLGARARTIQVTSYAELALAPQAADLAHPAFSNLFVETEFVSHAGAVIATRRKRSADETSVWAAHVLVVEGETIGELQYETDRAKFLGRARDVRNAVSILDGRDLSNSVGSVLDPVMSLRRTVLIPPATTVRLSFSTIVAPTREGVLDLADKYRDASTFERISTLAWTQAQVQLHHLGIHPEEAQLFQMLANAVLYSDVSMRPSSDLLSKSSLDLPVLWAQGISGDLPIVLARIDDNNDVEIIRQLLRAHEYWRMKQLSADLVIINEQPTSYVQELQGSLEALVRGSQLRLSPDTSGVSGKIVLLRGDLISPETRTQLQSVARAVILSHRGTLSEQITRSQPRQHSVAAPQRVIRPIKGADVPLPKEVLQSPNGLGGFAEKGREYVIVLQDGLRTPEPWINVIANPSFGFLVSESGVGFTWSINSHENQITPWSNDHVTDTPGEAIYVRDEASGEVWSPTALPIRGESATYIARHGQGYSRFQNESNGIALDLVQYVPLEDPIKISRLVLQNNSGRKRRLSVAAYAEWVLGSSRSASAPFLITEIDLETGALFARSAWNGEFGGRIAFSDLGGLQNSYTGDRTEFLGRNGSAEYPAALARGGPLSGHVGAGLDPCAALQTTLELAPGARVEIVFFLGEGENRERVRELLNKYRSADLDEVLRTVTTYWDDVLGAVQVTTPDPGMDLMLNRWLLYQTLACRVWARAAFYQLSGAYGFRDQLQDVLALTVPKREITREQLLLAASRQFTEGDVQHWWHPPSGRGVRTRISDDLLWLPYSVFQFIEATGDITVLDEPVPFLEGDRLAEGQDESYFQPRTSATRATIFEHCARALDRSLAVGSHGLPLMGTGDWNDGMNHVGEHGRGESVWLGWFLHTVLWEFAKIAESRGEPKRAETWRLQVSALKAALERDGWDGEWYRRAFFDDGTPLGSTQDSECRIDSIAQSWGVISGAGERARTVRAMAAVNTQLVRRPAGLILLLTPPFDHTPLDPGYIKGYLPGIRENGGQYTHAATWVLIAFAALGDGDKAGELFQMLNPINRTNTRAGVQRYKVEPYVVAGDIYSEPPHVGRGGWTWYTGSAGWLYRAGMEWMLGFRVRGTMLSIDPCIPRAWPGYSISFRYHSSVYEIKVENPSGVSRGVALAEFDGKPLSGPPNIALVDDGAVHQIRIVLG
ncbi:MAG TPA: glucoamylase family protein [Candidatus Acidoferrales bacterium]|nr:glucoamylase family protein [Candidatus Acidoferrales bacterium]